MYVYVCMCVCILCVGLCVRSHVCMCMCMYMCVHVCARMHARVCMGRGLGRENRYTVAIAWVVIRLVHIALFACLAPLCVSVPSVCVHMYVCMASSEPMVEPLLIRQLPLICASLYGTLLCQANIADHSYYTRVCVYSTYENLHIIAHIDTAAPVLATVQQLQEAFTVFFTCSNHCLVLCGVCALCAL